MTRVFSFCIYGPPNPKYYTGLLENLQLIDQHYPGWGIFVYVGADVPREYIDMLSRRNNVAIRETGIVGHKNSVYRFFAIDEPWVDLMMVRDADSRVHWKDRWAIRSFLASNYTTHIIRDNKYHTNEIMAGLWGIRKNPTIPSIRSLFLEWTPVSGGSGSEDDPHGFGIDQNFLKLVLYEKLRANAYVTYSNHRIMPGEIGIEFPFEWDHAVYCGRLEEINYVDTNSTDRISDVIQLPKTVIRFEKAHSTAQPENTVIPNFRELPSLSKSSSNGLLSFINRK
jgi:hypothetical protein